MKRSDQFGRIWTHLVADGRLNDLSRSELLVYNCIVGYGDANGRSSISRDHMARILGLSKRSVSRAVRALFQAGLLNVRFSRGRLANQYRVLRPGTMQTPMLFFENPQKQPGQSSVTPTSSATGTNRTRNRDILARNSDKALSPIQNTQSIRAGGGPAQGGPSPPADQKRTIYAEVVTHFKMRTRQDQAAAFHTIRNLQPGRQWRPLPGETFEDWKHRITA